MSRFFSIHHVKTNRFFPTALLFLAVLASPVLSGCMRLSGSITSLVSKNDFLKTEFIVGGPQPADGVSQLLVGLQLKNSDNKAVGGYKPEYIVVSGGGVITSDCTTSNSDGISACILKAVEAGQKTLQLTNAKVGLKQNIVFGAPQGAKVGNLVSGSTFKGTTAQGSKVSASFGSTTAGIKRTTSAGYVINFSIHGTVVPQ